MQIINSTNQSPNDSSYILEANYIWFTDLFDYCHWCKARTQFYIKSSLKRTLRPYDRIQFLN